MTVVTYPSTSGDFTFTSGTSTQSPAKPANTADGDLLIAVTSGRNGAFASIGSGWTTLIADYTTSGSIGHAAIHYLKVPVAASAPASWTFTFVETRASVLIFRVVSADLTSPFPGTNTGFNASNTPVMTIPSASSAGSGFSVSFTYFQEFDLAVPNNPFGNGTWPPVYNVGITGSNRQAIVVAAGNDGGSGSTASFTVTLDGQWPIEGVGTVSNQAAVAVIGVRAASGGAQSGAAALAASPSLAASATVSRRGAAALAAPGALTSSAFLGRRATAALSATATVTAGAFIGRRAVVALPAAASLTTSAFIGRKAAAALPATPAIAVSASIARRGAVALTAAPAMAASASAGRSAAALLSALPVLSVKFTAEDQWNSYLAAFGVASVKWANWRMMRQAGGTDGTAGFLFGQAYEAQAVADQAYEAWRLAQQQAFPGRRG